MKRLLVVGVPRSGTTWVGRVLAAAVGTELLDEPDNHFVSPYAYKVKRLLEEGSYPRLEPDAHAPGYAALWRHAFGSDVTEREPRSVRARRRASRELLQRVAPADVTRALGGTAAPGRALRLAELLAVPERPPRCASAVVVKSVYASLSIEWITRQFAPGIAVVVRDPLNVLSSWVEMEWLADDPLAPLDAQVQRELAARYDAPLPDPQWTTLERATWLVGALTSTLADLGDVPGARVVVTHESLARTREEGFRRVADELDLGWNAEAEVLLRQLDRPGRGFETTRPSTGLEEVWRARLSPDQVRAARTILDFFPAARTGDR